jgi:hypothetical protein
MAAIDPLTGPGITASGHRRLLIAARSSSDNRAKDARAVRKGGLSNHGASDLLVATSVTGDRQLAARLGWRPARRARHVSRAVTAELRAEAKAASRGRRLERGARQRRRSFLSFRAEQRAPYGADWARARTGWMPLVSPVWLTGSACPWWELRDFPRARLLQTPAARRQCVLRHFDASLTALRRPAASLRDGWHTNRQRRTP